jgi:hypothetical protein
MNRINRLKNPSKYLAWCMTLLFTIVMAGCGQGRDPVLGGNESGSPGTPGAEPTVPAVVSVIPVAGTTIPLNTKVFSAIFSEPMDPATITGATFTLACPLATPFAGVVAYLSASNTATLTIPALPNLPPSTLCTATITTAAQSIAAVPLDSNYVWSFTTGLTVDTTAPTLVTTGAFNGETGLPINRNSTATFSEAMDPATLVSPATNFTVTCALPCVSPVAGVVTYIGTTATFNPNAALLPSTTYTSTITTGAKDLAGNALIAGARPNPWSWTTGSAADTTKPTVISTSPANADIGICLNKSINATFSEAMTVATISPVTFTLQVKGPPLGSLLAGTVTYDVVSMVATFNPGLDLLPLTEYTATITTASKDLAGNGLAVNKVWSFTTGTGGGICTTPVPLGSLTTFVAVAGAGLTNSNSGGTTTLNGDVGLTPTATCLGDGSPCTLVDPVINGTLYANDPGGVAAQAKVDITAAYVDAMGRPPGTTVNDISGMVLPPGVYTSGSTMSIAVGGTVTLDAQGDANAVWIFQIGSSLTVNNNAQVLIINGGKANNVFWAAFASTTIGGNVDFKGNVFAGASNSVGTGSTVLGRLLCTTGQITLLSNTITLPTP